MREEIFEEYHIVKQFVSYNTAVLYSLSQLLHKCAAAIFSSFLAARVSLLLFLQPLHCIICCNVYQLHC